MPNPSLFQRTLVTVLLLGAGLMLSGCAPDQGAAPAATAQAASSAASTAPDGTAIVDPRGDYKLFSDPAITRPPAADTVFGNGQTLTVEYDGSKSAEGSSLFYRLYFVRPDGSVHQVADRAFENGMTRGTFSTSAKTYDSDANGRPGFIEVFTVTDVKLGVDGAAPSSKTVKLGMYPIRHEVGE